MSPGCELLWHPPARLLLDHHLFTEEEVLRHCVETGFVFPEYECKGSIVFVASEFSQSPISQQTVHLQYLWVGIVFNLLPFPPKPPLKTVSVQNDCAVTTDDGGRWFLLETNPGREFRKVAFRFGLSAARAAFRRKVDAACFGWAQNLGSVLQNTYTDLTRLGAYLDLADTVRPEELLSWDGTKPWDEKLCNVKPLGGQSYDVYRAKWRCPPRLGMPSDRTFDVILKRIWPPGAQQQSRNEARQLREVGGQQKPRYLTSAAC